MRFVAILFSLILLIPVGTASALKVESFEEIHPFSAIMDFDVGKDGKFFSLMDGYSQKPTEYIRIEDNNGNTLHEFGENGGKSFEYQLFYPENIAVNDFDQIFVDKPFFNKIQIFESDGQYVKSLGYSKDIQMMKSYGKHLVISTGSNFEVVDLEKNKIVTKGGGYCSLHDAWRYQKFMNDDSNSYDERKSWENQYNEMKNLCGGGNHGDSTFGDGKFLEINDIVMDSHGNVYAVDKYTNSRIQKFDANGNFVKKWNVNTPWGQNDYFASKMAIYEDYLIISTSDDIQVFDTTGKHLLSFGSACIASFYKNTCADPDGDGPKPNGYGQFDHVTNIDVDENGVVYLLEHNMNKIMKYTLDFPVKSNIVSNNVDEQSLEWFLPKSDWQKNNWTFVEFTKSNENNSEYVEQTFEEKGTYNDLTITISEFETKDNAKKTFDEFIATVQGISGVNDYSADLPIQTDCYSIHNGDDPIYQSLLTCMHDKHIFGIFSDPGGKSYESLHVEIMHDILSNISFESISIPDWVRNNAAWWADGSINDDAFVSGIQYLIKEGIISIPATQSSGEGTDEIPEWIRNNAKWWADDSIDDESFISGIQYLVEQGIIRV